MDHIVFTTVDQFYNKYNRCNIPVRLVCIHEDYNEMVNCGKGINLMIGRIQNGCFIEDATGEWWIQELCDDKGPRYFEPGDESTMVYLKPRRMSWLHRFAKVLDRILVYPDGDNLVTDMGVLVGSKVKEEEL